MGTTLWIFFWILVVTPSQTWDDKSYSYLKPDVDQLDIEKLQNVPSDLRNVTSNVDKLDADRLLLVPVDLSKLSDAVKADVVKKIFI